MLDGFCERDRWVTGLVPNSDLKPQTEYEVWNTDQNRLVATFTTGTSRDEVDPDFSPGDDDDDVGLHLDFTGSDDLVLAVTTADIDMGAICIVRTLSGGELDMRGAKGDAFGHTPEWRDQQKVVIVDKAGNTTTVTIPMNDACSCNVAGAPGQTHGSVLLLALLVLGARSIQRFG